MNGLCKLWSIYWFFFHYNHGIEGGRLMPGPGHWGQWTKKDGCETTLIRANEFMNDQSVTVIPKWLPLEVPTRHNVFGTWEIRRELDLGCGHFWQWGRFLFGTTVCARRPFPLKCSQALAQHSTVQSHFMQVHIPEDLT
jgi:hypothetical protein